MKCSVKKCKNNVKFKFPTNEVMKRKWLKAINEHFNPSPKQGLCIKHFDTDCIITESRFRKYLKIKNYYIYLKSIIIIK